MTNDGTITVSIGEGLMNDAAGNTNTQSVNTQNSISYDNTKPDVAITSTEASPTSLSQIPVVIEFSSEVSGFELSDINFSNCIISALNETIANLRWEAVVAPNSDGSIVLEIPANIAEDAAGNGNNASNSFSIDYERGNSAPLVDNQAFSVDEGSTFGTLVGQVVASDSENDGLIFSIVSGNLDNAFNIDAQTGDITVSNQEALNYYIHPVFSLVVVVEDDFSTSLSTQAEVEITLNEINYDFEANNIFTPNSPQNRYWRIKRIERYADYELTIRNNTGRIVYQTKNYQNNWNGTFNNNPLPTGTYYYFFQNGVTLYKGFINIIQE
jgi:gliding motility-associated-like protein